MLSTPLRTAEVELGCAEDLGSVISKFGLAGWHVFASKNQASFRRVVGLALAIDLLLAGIYGLATIYPPAAPSHVIDVLHGGLGVPLSVCRLVCPALSLAMLSVALEGCATAHTLHWKVPERVKSHMPQGEHAVTVWKAFRFDIWVALLLLSLVAGVSLVMLFFSPVAWLQVALTTVVPLAVALSQDMLADYLLQFLRVTMETAVTTLRDRVTETAGGSAEEWSSLVPEYMHLRQELAEFRDSFGTLLSASLALQAWGTFLFLMASLDSQLAVGWRCAMAALSLLSAYTALKKLKPLAKITALCQSTIAGSKSLLTAAVEGDSRDVVHSIAFTTHVLNFPTGVSLPGDVYITNALIMNCARVLALYSSTAVYFALKFAVGIDR